MKLQYKIFGAILFNFALILIPLFFITDYKNKQTIQEKTFSTYNGIVDSVVQNVQINMIEKTQIVKTLSTNDMLKNSVIKSNQSFEELEPKVRDSFIDTQNNKWKKERDIPNNQFINSYTNNPLAHYLNTQIKALPGVFGEIFITNRYGTVVASTSILTTYAHAHKYWWKNAYDNGRGKIFFDDRGFDESVEGYVLGVVIPLRDTNNEVIGILKANMNIDTLLSHSIRSYYAHGEVQIVRSKGLIIAQKGLEPLSSSINKKLIEKINSDEKGVEIIDDKVIAHSVIPLTFHSHLYGFGGNYKSIDHQKGNQGEAWHVIMSEDTKKAFDPVEETITFIIIGAVLMFILVSFFSLYLGRWIEKLIEEIQFTQSQYQYIVETTSDWIWKIDKDGLYTFSSPQVQHLLGYEVEDILGKSYLELLTREDQNELDTNYHQLLKEQKPLKSVIHKNVKKDGSSIILESEANPIFDKNGNFEGYIGTDRDVTARIQIQIKLEESNNNLQQFAYIASHDLKEPLRMISGHLQLIERQYKEKLDEKGHKFLNFAVDGALRLQKLIDGLLVFSRVQTHGKEFEYSDLNKILDEVKENLLEQIKTSQAIIDADELPTLLADSSQISQVFQNIISNSIKFCPDKTPHIIISTKETADSYEITFKDNGVGFNMKYKDKVFDIFKRLHNRSEFEGEGIGMALVKRIITRHNGTVFVQSEEGKGTSFCITLPKKHSHV